MTAYYGAQVLTTQHIAAVSRFTVTNQPRKRSITYCSYSQPVFDHSCSCSLGSSAVIEVIYIFRHIVSRFRGELFSFVLYKIRVIHVSRGTLYRIVTTLFRLIRYKPFCWSITCCESCSPDQRSGPTLLIRWCVFPCVVCIFCCCVYLLSLL